MGLFSKKKKIDTEINIDEAIKTNTNNIPVKFNKNKIRDFLLKSIGAITSQSDIRTRFVRPEYNL